MIKLIQQGKFGNNKEYLNNLIFLRISTMISKKKVFLISSRTTKKTYCVIRSVLSKGNIYKKKQAKNLRAPSIQLPRDRVRDALVYKVI